jgi:hypothetical protein
MYGRVTVRFYGYNTAGKRGVGCGLGNVLKTRDGEALAGGASAEMDFAGLEQVSPAPAAYQAPATAYATVAARGINPITGLPM